MDIIDSIQTKWRKEFNSELPAELVARLESQAHSPVSKSVIHKLSTIRDESSVTVQDLKSKLEQEEFFCSVLSGEIEELRSQSEMSLLQDQEDDASALYAKVNKSPKGKQTSDKAASSPSEAAPAKKAMAGCDFDLAYDDIKFEVIDKEETQADKHKVKPASPTKREPRRSVRDKIKMFQQFERSDSDSPEDGGDYETIVCKPVPPKPSTPKPASPRRRPQVNEYDEIDLPTGAFGIPKVVIVNKDQDPPDPVIDSNKKEKQDDINNSSKDDKTNANYIRKSPVKPPKPIRRSQGKEECNTTVKAETTSPQYSENEPTFSSSLKKQPMHNACEDTKVSEVIKVDKTIANDSDEEGDYCTLQDMADKHVSVVRVQSGGSETDHTEIERKVSADGRNVTVLNVNRTDRELSRSTENLSLLAVKSTTISRSVEDLTSGNHYDDPISSRKLDSGKLNDPSESGEKMKKSFDVKTELPGGHNSKLLGDSEDSVICKSLTSVKSACSNSSEEDPDRLNTINVDIHSILTPEELELAKANCPVSSPALPKKERRRRVPDYEKWNFQSLLTQPGISLVDNDHLTDTGSEDDMYDNAPTHTHIPSGLSDDSGWSETTSPEESQRSEASVEKSADEKSADGEEARMRQEEMDSRKGSMMSSSTEGSRVSTLSCVTVDGDSVFLQRCDSLEGQDAPLPSPTPSPSPYADDDQNKIILDEDNFSICSNDDVLDNQDKGDFEETLTEESLQRSYQSEQLRMRHLVVRGILESERAYLNVIEQLCKAKHYLQSVAMGQREQEGRPGIALQDVTTIFYKLDDIYKIHHDFVEELDMKLNSWNDDQSVASAFKMLIVYFKVYEEYVNNYPVAVETIRKYQENEETRQLLEKACVSKIRLSSVTSEQMEPFKDDAIRLEEILLKPVQRIQTNNLVLHDLIKHTPSTHVDAVPLQKALRLSEENLKTYNDQQALSRKRDAPESRHLVKSGFLVEVSRDKKQTRQLRYVFLFNDVVICTKHKGGGRHKEVSFKFLWSLPVSALTIHVKGEHKYQLKESLEDLKCKIGSLKSELRDEMLKADTVKDKAFSLTQKKAARNIEKLRKKVQEQEATLVEALPRLPLNLEAEGFKARTFLFPTDYERAEWREGVEAQRNRYRGLAAVQLSNHECDVLIDNTKLHMQVNGIGTVLLKKDEEMLNGSLNVTIHKMQGLEAECEVYCCIEMDSYGHFYKKAQTRVCRYMNDASWDEDFELELDGSQTLRILCYKKQPVDEDDTIIGKCALELSLTWLNSKFNEKTISMNDLSITISIRHTPASRTLKRTQSKLRSGVFGVRIANITKRENRTVPSIVTTCVQQVETRGLGEVGIYRVSGVTSEVQNLKKIFDKNPVMAGHHTENADIHAVTGVLKLFFRELPEPLFTEQCYQPFVQTIVLQNEEAKEKCLLELLHSLPEANYYTIVYMVEHLVRVSLRSGENKMSINNLATIFGPTLLHPAVRETNEDPTLMMVKAARDASIQCEILHFLIKLAASGKNIRKSASMQSGTSASQITESAAL